MYDRTKSGKILLRYQESTFGSKTLNSKSSEIAKTGKKKGEVIFRSIKKKKNAFNGTINKEAEEDKKKFWVGWIWT